MESWSKGHVDYKGGYWPAGKVSARVVLLPPGLMDLLVRSEQRSYCFQWVSLTCWHGTSKDRTASNGCHWPAGKVVAIAVLLPTGVIDLLARLEQRPFGSREGHCPVTWTIDQNWSWRFRRIISSVMTWQWENNKLSRQILIFRQVMINFFENYRKLILIEHTSWSMEQLHS